MHMRASEEYFMSLCVSARLLISKVREGTFIVSQKLECPDPRSTLTPSLAYFPRSLWIRRGRARLSVFSAQTYSGGPVRPHLTRFLNLYLSLASKLPPVNRLKRKAVNKIKTVICVKFNMK